MSKLAKSLDKLFTAYDKARADAKAAKNKQEDLNTEIKTILEKEKLEEAETPDFTCIYKYEKDKDVFDAVKFEKADPNKYKQYVELMEEMKAITKKYTKKEKGARKLIVTRKNEEEE